MQLLCMLASSRGFGEATDTLWYDASQAAASIAMPQRQSRMGELSEFQKGITVGMNNKDASNREIGRWLEMNRNEATVLV